MKRICIWTALVVVAVAVTGCGGKQETPPPPVETAAPEVEAAPALVAKATLTAREGETVAGEVTFTEADGAVAIVAHITGAPQGSHGFHVHEVGDCSSADFKSAGGHFNPTDMPHGAPTDMERHAGDLGNVEVAEDGTAHHETSSSMIAVADGPSSVVGRAVILHEDADDLVSQPTGAAGGRLACGVIELVP
jgi:Cu-Zn family superoxide dismutase